MYCCRSEYIMMNNPETVFSLIELNKQINKQRIKYFDTIISDTDKVKNNII